MTRGRVCIAFFDISSVWVLGQQWMKKAWGMAFGIGYRLVIRGLGFDNQGKKLSMEST